MSNCVLGLNIFGHDASACLVDCSNGEVLYAIAEERISNIKHDPHYPAAAIQQCIDLSNRIGQSIIEVAVNLDDTLFVRGTLFSELNEIIGDRTKFNFLSKLILDIYNFGDYFGKYSYTGSFFNIEIKKLGLTHAQIKFINKRMSWYFNWGIKYKNIINMVESQFGNIPITKVEHHLAHAASAYFNSGFREATVLVIDGQGESTTTSIYTADINGLSKVVDSNWPNSLGIFYLNVTNHLGFRFGDEFRVMGMAAYGDPVYYEEMKKSFSVKENGTLIIENSKYISIEDKEPRGHFCQKFNSNLNAVIPQRKKDDRILQCHFDFAASAQLLVEDIGVKLAQQALRLTNIDKLALAGGVALNGLMNENIRQLSGFKEVFIYPAAGDDGTAIGAAQYVCHKKKQFVSKRITNCYFGSSTKNSEIEEILINARIKFSILENIPKNIACALNNNKIVARFHGRSEFGPRALGHRTILANPRSSTIKDELNSRIKHRESFRPFAPICINSQANKYFEINIDSPFMMLICKVRKNYRNLIPAVVHADGTCRLQTVCINHNSDLYSILTEFERLGNLPILLNTSFNINREAIVESAQDAIESFIHMDIDYLAIENYWIRKTDNKDKPCKLTDEQYLAHRTKRYHIKYLSNNYRLYNILNFNKCMMMNE